MAVALVAAAGCGQVTIEDGDGVAVEDSAADADSLAGGDGLDSVGSECQTDFDCAGIKGKTPCNFPICDAGFCKLKLRDAGTACKDLSLVLTSCQESTCDAAGACVLTPKAEATACEPGVPLQPCQQAGCDATGQCKVASKADGAHCGLGVCGNKCAEGNCVLATATDYDDGNACTKDFCDQGAKVVHQPITDLTLACDDGDACTKGDFCLEGACNGTPDACNDGIACTADACDKASGCQHVGDDAKCVDGGPCVKLACALAVGCTATSANEGATCDDGDSCTSGDVCSSDGSCAGPKNTCACASDGDCDQSDKCKPRVCDIATSGCVVDQAKEVKCDTSADGSCRKTACVPASGTCVAENLNEGKQCDDNSVCTSASVCAKGVCAGAVDKACDDKNPCTAELCDPIAGCQSTPAGDTCDDGNACSEKDACVNGACVGTVKPCDDGVACTFDSCDASSGTCVNTPDAKGCDDGNPCTADSCDATGAKGCASSADDSATCDDGDVCTNTACKGGQCQVISTNKDQPGCGCGKDAECNDNNPCTADTCKAGDCSFDPAPLEAKACDTGNLCHIAASGACNAGACQGGKPKDCSEDASACVDAACNPKTGSCDKATKADGSACDADGSLCTANDVCKAGTCTAGTAVSCSGQGDACNLAACDAKTGTCKTTPAAKGFPCDDGTWCTDGDGCDGAGKCSAGKTRDCSGAGDSCHTGSCDEKAQQCAKIPKAAGTACDDGQFCTEKEVCDGKGLCAGGKAKVCSNGGNACLSGVCDEAKDACATAPGPKGGACDDKNPCTLGDVCDGAGKCAAGSAKECPGEACKDGVCNTASGICESKPKVKGTACNDGDQCTQVDGCDGAGACLGSNPKACAGDACNDGTCAPATGACGLKAKANGAVCEDGNDCTSGDTCSGGVCKAGTYTCACKLDADCDDKNACTKDVCAKVGTALTCTNTITGGAPCNDGDACTSGDVCDSYGKCGGKAVACDDGNACTADACDAKTGTCVAPPQAKGFPCDDKNLCTVSDSCNGAGSCGGSAVACDDANVCTDDACDPVSGKCKSVANASACSDGNPCTLSDICSSGACTAGKAKDCNDGTICTSDMCSTKTGSCVNLAVNEGSSCEIGSYSGCTSGKCMCRVGVATSSLTSTASFQDVAWTADQGTVAVGRGPGTATSGADGWIERRNKGRQVQWTLQPAYNPKANYVDALQGVSAIPGTTSFVAVGYTTGSGIDGWMLRFDDAGTIAQQSLIAGGAQSDYLRDVTAVDATTAYAVGYSYSLNAQSTSYTSLWLVRLNPSSTNPIVWQKARVGLKIKTPIPLTYTFSHYAGYGVAWSSSTGKVYTAGSTSDEASGGTDGLLMIWDTSGNIVATKRLGGTGADYLFDVQVYGSSSVWAVGSYYNGTNGTDAWLVRSSPTDLTTYTDVRYGGTATDEFQGVSLYGSSVFAFGRTYDTAVSRYRPWLFRSTSTGSQSASMQIDTNAYSRTFQGGAYNPTTGYVVAVGDTATSGATAGYTATMTTSGGTYCGSSPPSSK